MVAPKHLEAVVAGQSHKLIASSQSHSSLPTSDCHPAHHFCSCERADLGQSKAAGLKFARSAVNSHTLHLQEDLCSCLRTCHKLMQQKLLSTECLMQSCNAKKSHLQQELRSCL